MDKEELQDIVYEAVESFGGSANIVQVCKYTWDNYETELRNSGDLFYTWQYDIRWAAQKLRDTGRFKKTTNRRDPWQIA